MAAWNRLVGFSRLEFHSYKIAQIAFWLNSQPFSHNSGPVCDRRTDRQEAYSITGAWHNGTELSRDSKLSRSLPTVYSVQSRRCNEWFVLPVVYTRIFTIVTQPAHTRGCSELAASCSSIGVYSVYCSLLSRHRAIRATINRFDKPRSRRSIQGNTRRVIK